jgi:hypothetical protein
VQVLVQLPEPLYKRKKVQGAIIGGVAGAGIGAGTGAIIDGSKKLIFFWLKECLSFTELKHSFILYKARSSYLGRLMKYNSFNYPEIIYIC